MDDYDIYLHEDIRRFKYLYADKRALAYLKRLRKQYPENQELADLAETIEMSIEPSYKTIFRLLYGLTAITLLAIVFIQIFSNSFLFLASGEKVTWTMYVDNINTREGSLGGVPANPYINYYYSNITQGTYNDNFLVILDFVKVGGKRSLVVQNRMIVTGTVTIHLFGDTEILVDSYKALGSCPNYYCTP